MLLPASTPFGWLLPLPVKHLQTPVLTLSQWAWGDTSDSPRAPRDFSKSLSPEPVCVASARSWTLMPCLRASLHLSSLAQSALVWTVQAMLPLAHPPLRVVLRCDNSASEAAAWKGLSMAKGLCCVLHQFCDLQHRSCISVHIEHVPGFLNEIADSLSRSGDPEALGFLEKDLPSVARTPRAFSASISPSRLIFPLPFLLFFEWPFGVGPAGSILIRLSLDFCPPQAAWLWCSLHGVEHTACSVLCSA